MSVQTPTPSETERPIRFAGARNDGWRRVNGNDALY
jgi:hypothetical protein